MNTLIHYTGRMFEADDVLEARLRKELIYNLKKYNVIAGYGSLAAGADIMFAETLIAHNASVHCILPFRPEDFKESSVSPFGKIWASRFDNLLDTITDLSVLNANETNENKAYKMVTVNALDKLTARSGSQGVSALQIAICDDRKSNSIAGTIADIGEWKKRGGKTIRIAL